MAGFGLSGFSGPPTQVTQAGETGSFLVLLDEDDAGTTMAGVTRSLGLTMASTADFASGAPGPDELNEANGLVFDALGVAVVDVAPDQVQALRQALGDRGVAVERERYVYALGDVALGAGAARGLSPEYLRGYLHGVQHLVGAVSGSAVGVGLSGSHPVAPPLAWDEAETTWGLQAVTALGSCRSGAGVRVAVLDTGFDLTHPDFVGRSVTSQSFVDGQEVQDGHGHGTHCIGTACGSLRPETLPRYGVAHGCDIFAGKVLSNQGGGADRGILAGINWAVTNECQVVSMSLGAPTQVGQPYSEVFERAASRAMEQGTLIIAAAGNDSRRGSAMVNPVSHPANCPSILAVAAIDPQLEVAPFSNAGINPEGGQIDIAGPGVGVRSSWPMPQRTLAISGTSMATPHVAGVAALLAEAHPDATAAELARRLTCMARRLPLASTDVGAGLVQAP
jgi:subtilisin family serine protease